MDARNVTVIGVWVFVTTWLVGTLLERGDMFISLFLFFVAIAVSVSVSAMPRNSEAEAKKSQS